MKKILLISAILMLALIIQVSAVSVKTHSGSTTRSCLSYFGNVQTPYDWKYLKQDRCLLSYQQKSLRNKLTQCSYVYTLGKCPVVNITSPVNGTNNTNVTNPIVNDTNMTNPPIANNTNVTNPINPPDYRDGKYYLTCYCWIENVGCGAYWMDSVNPITCPVGPVLFFKSYATMQDCINDN